MLSLFKIFVFLFLQQGTKVPSANGEKSINWEAILLSCNATLTVQADPMVIEQALGVCIWQDTSCQIIRETMGSENGSNMERASVSFKNLSNAARNKMMERLQIIQGGACFRWDYQIQ
jgi:hypothetical protein